MKLWPVDQMNPFINRNNLIKWKTIDRITANAKSISDNCVFIIFLTVEQDVSGSQLIAVEFFCESALIYLLQTTMKKVASYYVI